MSQPLLEQILEAVLLAAARPLPLERLRELFEPGQEPANDTLRAALERLREQCSGRACELVETASGWRLQVRADYAPWVGRLWEERPQRYSRALLETLALIAYRQPITRGEIEDIRGVAVSSQIIRTLQERDWIRVVGHREVPGRPALFATTRQFLDHFNLRSLAELPPLAELRSLEQIEAELPLQPLQAAATGETAVWLSDTAVPDALEPPEETDFGELLEQLGSMEANLKTDFDDPLRPSARSQEQGEGGDHGS